MTQIDRITDAEAFARTLEEWLEGARLACECGDVERELHCLQQADGALFRVRDLHGDALVQARADKATMLAGSMEDDR
jgi:hypothetical protein